MENVVFIDNWQSFFEQHGFVSFDDFFGFDEGDTINVNTKRNVSIIKLASDDGEKTFYMKRFFDPHYKDILSTAMTFGKPCTQGELEWRYANILLDNGIETYHPACYGSDTQFGLEKRSFFITEAINGCCMTDYLLETWTSLADEQRAEYIVKLAEFFKRIHAGRFSFPDAYIWHVYMVYNGADKTDFQFGMIDLHRMKIRVRGSKEAAENIGRFLYSIPDGFMDDSLRKLFMDTYLDADFIKNKEAFSAAAYKREQIMLKRRKKPDMVIQ
ncbi:MAG: lipopolysaccharide kinase InaA family protein [Planctomycetota bacterium]|jgi:hypothetical protein